MKKHDALFILENMWSLEDCCEFQDPVYSFGDGESVVNPEFIKYCEGKRYFPLNNTEGK